MATERRTRAPRRSAVQWKDLVVRQECSGLDERAFCREEGVGYSTFRRWRNRLKERRPNDRSPAASQTDAPVSDTGEWIGLPIAGEAALGRGWDVELELGGGIVLRVRRG